MHQLKDIILMNFADVLMNEGVDTVYFGAPPCMLCTLMLSVARLDFSVAHSAADVALCCWRTFSFRQSLASSPYQVRKIIYCNLRRGTVL